MISRMSSGSSRAERAVEPTRSQNMIASWRRSAPTGASLIPDAEPSGGGSVEGAAGLSGVSVLPHFEQNFAPARLAAPQDRQRAGRAAPHTSQKRLSSGISEWQLGHSMSAL